MQPNTKTIAVDFDGTLCTVNYPEIGEPRPRIIDIVKHWKDDGHTLILWTCRVDMDDRKYLTEAVEWCKEQGLEFDFVNENDPKRIALYSMDTRKVSADLYFDDKNVQLDIEHDDRNVNEIAQSLIHGNRQEDYGDPVENWKRTASVAYNVLPELFARKPKAHEMVMMLQSVKLVREGNKRKRDNRVDLSAYSDIADMCLAAGE